VSRRKEKRVAFEKAPQNFCLERFLKDARIRIPGINLSTCSFENKFDIIYQ
jgi:hypothetical protein